MTAAGYLLDTNVSSESTKMPSDTEDTRWLTEVDEDPAFLGVATVAEIHFGVERMPRGRRREQLPASLADELPERFEGRLLGVDRPVADARGVRCSGASAPVSTLA